MGHERHTRERLVVFGAGGHAKVLIEAALTRSPATEVIVIDDAEDARERSVLGIRVLSGRGELARLERAPVALGIGDNRARAELLSWLRRNGHPIAAVIHPRALVAPSVRVGDGVFVSAGAIVIAEASIGDAAIINTGASVDHDCVVGEAAHIAPGAHLCGNVRIGARTLVGVGSSIRPGVSVCDDVVLGAGSVVVRDIVEPGTFVGNPVKRLR